MNDRELLELAAKSVGYHLEYLSDIPHMIIEEWSGDPSQHPEQRAIEWNPLTDDGDALRLAASIPACIVIDHDMHWCGVHLNGERGKYDLGQAFVGDTAECIRRAIVRAAAEIGASMP
jgi:hypothetical protein